MERTKKEKSLKKLLNRSFSYLILFAGIFSLCYSIKVITEYVSIKKENAELQETLDSLRKENDRLEITNSKLKDKDYFSVYVEGKYQYSSSSDSIVPIN